jgi:hypothetical protein
MESFRLIIAMTALVLLLVSCRKGTINNKECETFKDAIEKGDKQRVSKAVRHLLTDYSSDNLTNFASSLSSACNTTAKVICYGCIDTNPEQSEIRVSFTSSTGVVSKILDLSYDDNHRMIIVGIHD